MFLVERVDTIMGRSHIVVPGEPVMADWGKRKREETSFSDVRSLPVMLQLANLSASGNKTVVTNHKKQLCAGATSTLISFGSFFFACDRHLNQTSAWIRCLAGSCNNATWARIIGKRPFKHIYSVYYAISNLSSVCWPYFSFWFSALPRSSFAFCKTHNAQQLRDMFL